MGGAKMAIVFDIICSFVLAFLFVELILLLGLFLASVF